LDGWVGGWKYLYGQEESNNESEETNLLAVFHVNNSLELKIIASME
jgi:hypothetical protein